MAPLGDDAVAMSGVLKKLTASVMKGDHDRFFELRGANLRYYKSRPAAGKTEKPLGMIDLRDTTTIEDPKKKLQWTISGPNIPKSYTLLASSDDEKLQWVTAIKNAVRTASLKSKSESIMLTVSDERFNISTPRSKSPAGVGVSHSPLKRINTMEPRRPSGQDLAATAPLQRVSTARRLLKKDSCRDVKGLKDSTKQSKGLSDSLRVDTGKAFTRTLSTPGLASPRSPSSSTRSPTLSRSGSNLRAPMVARTASTGDLFGTHRQVNLDAFDLLCVIGKGSFGKVMQVRKKDTKEVFAMKCMSKELILREGLVEHMKAEKNILGAINHPYIVKLHYAFQTADSLFLVLDFLSGGELFYHLSQVGTFPESRAKFYTAQIGLALGHLHSLNIIYRDLKPENCVLDSKGNCCITDFGLAKPGINSKEETSTFCGTPEYLAPEFLESGCCHGRAVDWWSLGILLYEMIAGLPPFYSDNINEMYEMIKYKNLSFPTGMGQDARLLCSRLLDRSKDRRMQTIEEMREHGFFRGFAFEELLDGTMQVPFLPDTKEMNFETQFTKMPAQHTGTRTPCKDAGTFAGFHFERRAHRKKMQQKLMTASA
eukprot:TRINITY_DN2404_c0_g1_i1.p1 TRINITY_DN2404_c0_g1~~TRINITY_DN2404_c0_g1_i1.p1  ORF type:complete len:642 (+),score=225.57 TRINITY_DN2404_c0_g1_i1:137-1927(+)